MTLPIIIKADLPTSSASRWQNQFVRAHRDYLEGLWRRTQSDLNAEESGKLFHHDQKRRLIHYLDRYAVTKNAGNTCNLVVSAPYLWLCISSPQTEIHQYLDQIRQGARKGGWKQTISSSNTGFYSLQDNLNLKTKILRQIPQDTANNRHFPSDYLHLEVEITSPATDISPDIRKRPWDVLKSGFRDKDKRGNPQVFSDPEVLKPFFPMQVELGCGPSIEAGIPPLHYLHQIYYVSDPADHTFIFGPQRDHLLLNILSDPTLFYQSASAPLLAALIANPTPFYRLLQKLYSSGIIVGPILTNNFDGICNYLDIPELYVRRYDEIHIVPKIDFHTRAKSLLVVGSHADRRKIQQSARSQNLKIIYIDPEGYYDGSNQFTPYPLESIQDNDLLFQGTAAEFTKMWHQSFFSLF